MREYTHLTGQTTAGKALSDEACAELLSRPVARTEEGAHRAAHWLKSGGRSHPLDHMVDTAAFIAKWWEELSGTADEEIGRLKDSVANQKLSLSRRLDGLRAQIRQTEDELEQAGTRIDKLNAQKRLTALQKELKQGEQSLFMDEMRLDLECEKQIEALRAGEDIVVKVQREFVVKMERV